jgi:hypothetical protein
MRRIILLVLAALAVLFGLGVTATTAFADETVPPPPTEAQTPAEAIPAPFALTANLASPAVSEKQFKVTVNGVDGQTLPPNIPLIAEWDTPWSGGNSKAVVFTDDMGVAVFSIWAWSAISVTVTAPDGQVTKIRVTVAPAIKPFKDPAGAPNRPKQYRINTDPFARGTGANAQILPISKSMQKKMTGLSWRPGCIPLSSLREVHVNYYGMDGFRHRGVIILNASVAKNVAKAFSDLYKIKYRMQSMHPVDVYGRNPRGPGANDYASMAAGNTSAFNCRFVVGKESFGVTSPHASGRAIDVNPWINPYISRTGVYPNSWWLHRVVPGVTFLGNSQLVSVFNRHGWSWGGSYGDYHHFDWRG